MRQLKLQLKASPFHLTLLWFTVQAVNVLEASVKTCYIYLYCWQKHCASQYDKLHITPQPAGIFRLAARHTMQWKGAIMPKGIQPKSIARENKLIHAGIKLFLENGYEKTTTAAISRAAGMSPTSFFASFESKEALLLHLTKMMFSGQFKKAGFMLGQINDPLMLYAVETCMQLHIVELSESLRELYVTAYTLPSTVDYIYASTAQKIMELFGKYMSGATRSDFIELEIASASIMRGYMAKRCDDEFTIERKIQRFLNTSLSVYRVPYDEQAKTIEAILKMDLRSAAGLIINETICAAEEAFNAAVKRRPTPDQDV